MREIPCNICGELIPEDEILTFDGQNICRDCYYEHTTVCECCEHRIWTENDYGDCNISLCETCRDEEYTTCDRCGRLVYDDDACYFPGGDTPYCQSCYDEMEEDAIHS